ncbi:uncharacterized protein LOC106130786 [Amyelois transitella]|uniref:uncharacterized protein LOC106130786 n=1 Tax=Amyelois transitella TaxID=680683 RepID=UPI00067C4FAE|nr:uncharacterized protein LOC106130786 [Amyelois transitella]
MRKIGILLLLCQFITLPIMEGRSDDENPFLDLASSFLQNMGDGGNNLNGLAAIGNIVGNLMQGDKAKNLGSMFGQDTNGNDGGDILSGLGSLLGGQDGKIDPAMIGTMMSMFASQMGNTDKPSRQKRESQNKNDFNIDGLLSLASGFLGNRNGGAESILPLIMNILSSFSDPESKNVADGHKDHAQFLPPFLEKIHLYWDLFINSELGKTVWEKSGLKKTMKAFTGPDGKISFELMFKNFENHSFRRHWIKVAAKYLTDTVVSVAKPEVYQKYMSSAQYFINGFLDSQGLPKHTHLNLKKPTQSISALLNYVLKKYLDIDTNVSAYVAPAIEYIKQTVKMGESISQSLAGRGDYNALVDHITDTLNLEVIEPVLRVYRAYQHSVKSPQCQEHLMCLVNRHHDKDKEGRLGFKAGLTKVSSLVASAALSYHNGKGFWDLYNAVKNDVNCDVEYPADCSEFHEHELKVTTEVYHSEL